MSFWMKMMQMDCKSFPVYANAQARDYAAMHEVRGAYRTLGQGLDDDYVVAPKHLLYNPGMKPVAWPRAV